VNLRRVSRAARVAEITRASLGTLKQDLERHRQTLWHVGCIHAWWLSTLNEEDAMPSTHTSGRPSRASATRKRTSRAPRTRNAIAILRADHKVVDELFQQYEKAKAQTRKQDLVERICHELIVHTTVEEEIFYPALRKVIKDRDMMDEADVEHASAKEMIKQLQAGKPGDDHYDAKVKVLGEYIRHHVKEEQTEMFPKAQKTRLDLLELGAQIQTRKAELELEQPSERNAEQKSKSSILSLLSFD
jgi:hypothetical protein